MGGNPVRRRFSRGLRAVLRALALVLALPAAAGAASFQVMSTGWTSFDGGVTQVPFDVVNAPPGPNGERSVTGSGTESAATASEITHYAAGSLFASAGPGVLKVKVDTLAYIDALPFYEPRVLAQAGAQLLEGLLVSSATLAPGTMADYQITLSVEIDHNSPIYYKPEGFPHGTFDLQLYFGSSGGTSLHLPVDFGGPSASWPIGTTVSFTQVLAGQAPVGSTIPINLSIGATAQEWVKQGDGYYHETHIDASNTIHVFADALTPGVSLVAESGHDYSTNAVPEPASIALAAFGLGTLAASRSLRPPHNVPGRLA